MRASLLLLALVALVAAGCGDYSGPQKTAKPAETVAGGGGAEGDFLAGSGSGGGGSQGAAKISVADAVATDFVGEVALEGYALFEGGNYLLCDKVTPQGTCGEPSVLMQGYDGDFSTEKKVTVRGQLDGDVLIVGS